MCITVEIISAASAAAGRASERASERGNPGSFGSITLCFAKGVKKEEDPAVIPNRAIEFDVLHEGRRGGTRVFRRNREEEAPRTFFHVFFVRDKEKLECTVN